MNVKKKVKEYLLVALGVLIASFAFSWFVDPYNVDVGGVAGLGIIIKSKTGIDSSIPILVFNIILVSIGGLILGKDFFLKTVFGSMLYPIFIYFFNYLYKVICNANGTEYLIDKSNLFMVIMVGALIAGFGLGYAVKHGGNTGGTEIIQNILYKYWRMSYLVSLVIFDGSVVLLGFLLMKDANGQFQFDYLMYAIIFIYVSGIVMDQVIFSGFNKRAVMIICNKPEEIKQRILEDLDRGVTVSKVIGGYTNEEKIQLMTVLSTSEFSKLKMILNDVDPNAFYYVVRANEVGGEGFSYDEEEKSN